MTSVVKSSEHKLARVCVTGGAGMIGRRLVANLAGRGIAVAVFDNLRSGLAMPIDIAAARNGDIRDEAAFGELLRTFRPDAIVHLAALHHIPTCETERAACLDINVTGTERMLAAASEAEIGRVVIASSGAVYQWTSGPLNEDGSPTEPRDNYALSKLCNEHQLRFWCERGGGQGRVARIFNAIGGDDPNAHLLPDILAQLRGDTGGSAVVRLGNVGSRRDYLHADDVAEGLVALLFDDRRVAFDVFNLASGQEHSVDEVVRHLAACLQRPVRIEIEDARRRKVDRPSQLGDPAKARTLLGWQASMTLREVLARLLEEIEQAG